MARSSLQSSLKLLEADWQHKPPELLPTTLKQTHSALEELAFLVAPETINSDARRPRVVQISLPPHHWLGLNVPGGRWGIDNPIRSILLFRVDAASSYVIRSLRRTPGPVDSNFSFGTLDVWGTIANIGQAQLQIAADGRYTITLDSTPANGRPTHIQLTNGGNTVFIRNTLADLSHENVDRIQVTRVSGPPAGPAPTDDELERMMMARLHTVIAHIIANLKGAIFRLPANVLPQPGKPGDKAGFLVTQRNAIGHFRLRRDEAMEATFNPGGADPGVANWVDTAGLEEGLIMLRWQVLPTSPNPAAEPGVKSQVVKWADFPSARPRGFKRVPAAQRKAALSARYAGFERRFVNRWN